MTFKLNPALIQFLEENGRASVMSGDKKKGVVVLRFKEGIEQTVTLDPAYAESLAATAFIVGSKWLFDETGTHVEVITPAPSNSSRGKSTGSYLKPTLGL